MSKRGKAPVEIATGAIIQRQGTGDRETITAAITMPASAWDELTAEYRSFWWGSDAPPAGPDTTLEARIAFFLDLKQVEWEACAAGYPVPTGGDLDDGVPF